jgi:hypothetical protein
MTDDLNPLMDTLNWALRRIEVSNAEAARADLDRFREAVAEQIEKHGAAEVREIVERVIREELEHENKSRSISEASNKFHTRLLRRRDIYKTPGDEK